MRIPLSARQPLRHPEAADRTVVWLTNQLLSRHDLARVRGGASIGWPGMELVLVRVIASVSEGEVFHAGNGSDGQTAVLGPAICPRCPRAISPVQLRELRPHVRS